MTPPPRPPQLVDALAEILAAAFDVRGLRGFLVGEPRGAELLRAVPRRVGAERLARDAAVLLFEAGIDNAFLARLASVRPAATADIAALAVALRRAGLLLPAPDAEVLGLDPRPACPSLIAGHRSRLAAIVAALGQGAGARVALTAPTASQLEGLVGALLRESGLYAAAPGGVFFVAPGPQDDLLFCLRTFGLGTGDAQLAWSPDVREARARMSGALAEGSLLVVLDRGAEPGVIEGLLACLGSEPRVLLATRDAALAGRVVGPHRHDVAPVSRGLAQDILMWWAWGAEGAEAPLQAIATALPADPEVLELAGRVMAGPPPLLEPAELLAAMVLLRSSGQDVGRQALMDRVLAALPADDLRRVLALNIYGPRATLDRELVAAAWGVSPRAAVLRAELRELAEFGMVRRRPDGRWLVPAVVHEGSRRWRERHGAEVRRALRSASVLLVKRLAEALRAWRSRDLPALARAVEVREAARGLWREAFRWGRSDRGVAGLCAQLSTLPADFLAWFLPAEEALMWAEGALLGAAPDDEAAAIAPQLRVARVCRALGRLEQAERTYQSICTQVGRERPRLLYELGRILKERGELHSARPQLEDALRGAQSRSDEPLLVEICELLGEVYQELDERVRARELFQLALRHVGPVAATRARLRLQVGELHLSDGNIADATEQLVKAGRLASAAQAPVLEARAARSLASCARSEGRVAESINWLQQARRALEGAGAVSDQVGVLRELAEVEAERGKLMRSLSLHRERAELLRASGDNVGSARALVDLGILLERRDKPDEALAFFTAGIRVAREGGDARGQARGLLAAGRLLLARGDETSALINLEAALILARTCGWLAGEAASLWRISGIERRLGQTAASLLHARAAVRKGEALDAQGRFEVRVNLVEALAALGDRGTAIAEARSLLDGRSDDVAARRLRGLVALWEEEEGQRRQA